MGETTIKKRTIIVLNVQHLHDVMKYVKTAPVYYSIFAGDLLPFSRGRITAPFPIENSHPFPNSMSIFPIKKSFKRIKETKSATMNIFRKFLFSL